MTSFNGIQCGLAGTIEATLHRKVGEKFAKNVTYVQQSDNLTYEPNMILALQ